MILRKELNEHEANQCPEMEVECPIPGCGTKMKRKDVEKHDQSQSVHHSQCLCLMTVTLQRTLITLTQQGTLIEKQGQEIRAQTELTTNLRAMVNSTKWVIDNFAERRTQ